MTADPISSIKITPAAASGAGDGAAPAAPVKRGAAGATFAVATPGAAAATAPDEAAAQAAAAVDAADARDVTFQHRSSRSGVLSPEKQFESFVLRSFIETMLPAANSETFGSGTAGDVWRSMLAERIGDELAAKGGIGIADMLTARKLGGTAAAAETVLGHDAVKARAAAVRGAGGL